MVLANSNFHVIISGCQETTKITNRVNFYTSTTF